MQNQSENIPALALHWHRAGRGAVLVTVVETWGSAPRRAGSQMVVDGAGGMRGSVSGGCVEGAVVLEAVAALAAGQARLLTYGVSDQDAFAVGLACGGTVRLLLQPVGAVLSEAVLAALVGQGAVALVTDLATFEAALVPAGADAAVDARLLSDRSGVDEGRFIAVQNPALRLVVVGAVQIAQALLPMARACGYGVTLIDPRTTFGGAERFPGEAIVEDWPDAALAALRPDARTAVVTLSHDAKLDDAAIGYALRSPVFYLGCLGSRRTHVLRLERLAAQGFAPEELARIHAPAGLDIGAASPAEIALSVLAEITQGLRRG